MLASILYSISKARRKSLWQQRKLYKPLKIGYRYKLLVQNSSLDDEKMKKCSWHIDDALMNALPAAKLMMSFGTLYWPNRRCCHEVPYVSEKYMLGKSTGSLAHANIYISLIDKEFA